VFVSSTIWDLTDVRAELREFLARNGFDPVMSDDERFPDDLKQAGTYEKCRQALMQCDIFLMIINSRLEELASPNPMRLLDAALKGVRVERCLTPLSNRSYKSLKSCYEAVNHSIFAQLEG
jgi:hypothetical protein